MTENIPRSLANNKKTPPHTAKSKIPENPRIARFPGQKCKKRQENKTKLLYFTIFTIKHNGFFTFLRFLRFRIRILSKSATFVAKIIEFATIYKGFWSQNASNVHFRHICLQKCNKTIVCLKNFCCTSIVFRMRTLNKSVLTCWKTNVFPLFLSENTILSETTIKPFVFQTFWTKTQ